MLDNFAAKLLRKKTFKVTEADDSDLRRCLSTFNLVSVGIGSTLGAGVYVLTGSVAKNDSGPSIILSFTVAAFASMLAGLCYAEFGARVPKAGSAYIYSYVTVGEFIGFIIGWNLILEYIIGVSSVARAWSANLDSLTGGIIANRTHEVMPMNINGFASYPDFLAVGLIVLVTIVLSIGMEVSSIFLTILTGINIAVLLFCSIAGFIKADSHNWHLQQSEIPEGYGVGGFMPYGFSKMMEGAATCFYAFVGFDTIACVGEEAKNPSKSIPRSIVITLIVCLGAYATVSSAVTLMKPYYLLDSDAPLPDAFKYVGLGWASKPIAVGSMCALIASVLGAAVGMPRIVFSMARDGLIFKFLSKVSNKTKAPVTATVLSGLLSSAMALIFDLNDLVNMMSIGTLMAYTLVAYSVLLLRYRPSECDYQEILNVYEAEETSPIAKDGFDYYPTLYQLFKPSSFACRTTSNVVLWSTNISVLFMILLSVMLIWGGANNTMWWGILLIVLLVIILVLFCLIIAKQPQSMTVLSFQTPLVPVLPLFSIFFNIYLMLKLPTMTWVRFAVWMVVGFLMYFGYGIRHSTEGKEIHRETISQEEEICLKRE